MIEKTLENWLDSASERSYQAVFVQMLAARDYRVVHSTRHTALEFGKDVLAIGPDGVGCAFQLKGNPGGKLGLTRFRSEIQPQLVQLMSQPVVFPGFPTAAHKSYLVSNGYFDEEVHRAVDDLNRGPYLSKVELISRGELLAWGKMLGPSLWPTELTDVRSLIELIFADSRDLLSIEKLSSLLGKVLAIDFNDSRSIAIPEFHRIITSAALLTGIATAHFAEAKNHFAVASAWALLAVMVIGTAEKHGHPLTFKAAETFDLAEAAALDALADLWTEIDERKHLVEGNAMVEPEVYGWRLGLLLGALSSLAIANEASPLLSSSQSERLNDWLLKIHPGWSPWGEGAIVNLIPWLVYARKHDPTSRPDKEISTIAELIISWNQRDSKAALASPYYSFEQVFKLKSDRRLGNKLGHETFAGAAYTAEPVFHLLVRTNLKLKCKFLWKDFSCLSHRGMSLAEPWHYCMYKVRAGRDETRIYPLSYEWKQLKGETIGRGTPSLPTQLLARPWLLAFWWLIAPHRYNTQASRYFAEAVVPGWGS